MGRPRSQVNADQYLGCWLYVNTAGTGADQTQPKASLSSKLSNHHFPSSRPRRLLSQGLCVCISATLFWAFMPHTISKPPLSSSPSLFLSFSAHQRDSNALCIMDGKQKKKKTMCQSFCICMTHEITGQERLKWSNKAFVDTKVEKKKEEKKIQRPRLINQCNVLRRVPPHEVSQPIRLK